jgi:aminobenzoyl-glutamate transport protein
VRGLFTAEGVRWFTTTVVANFVGFPPLGTVVVILLGVGLAQRSGLLSAVIKRSFAGAPSWALPYAVALVCMVGHVMSDSVMIVIPPLAAMVFAAAGRHPVARRSPGRCPTPAPPSRRSPTGSSTSPPRWC